VPNHVISRALTFTETGDIDKVLSLTNHDLSTKPPPGHVLVQFLASPINPADVNQVQGTYPSHARLITSSTPSTTPFAVGGNEGVAKVIFTSPDITNVKAGDWILPFKPSFGTWRSHAIIPKDEMIVIKDEQKKGLTPIQVGTASINPITAWRLLKDYGKLEKGDWLVQNGANSGVGRAAIQLAKEFGFKSLNIIRRRDQNEEHILMVEELKELGADVVVTDDEIKDKERIRELTNNNDIKLGLNCVGGRIVNDMAKLMAEDSHFVTYGGMSKKPVNLPTAMLIFKNITFYGFWLTKWSKANPKEKQKTLDSILDMIQKGKLKDVPVEEIEWSTNTVGSLLVDKVNKTLDGHRQGKGIFIFKDI